MSTATVEVGGTIVPSASLLRCTLCKLVRPAEDFHRQPGRKTGRMSRCCFCQAITKRAHRSSPEGRAASRAYELRRDFGITVEQYAEMLASQDGVCAICQKPPTRVPLAVDHDHQTGRVRGLLCTACNLGLGIYESRAGDFASYLEAST